MPTTNRRQVKLCQLSSWCPRAARVLKLKVTYSEESSLGVEFSSGILVVVDKGETSASSTTELGLQAEHGDLFFITFHGLRQFGLDISLGHVGHVGVNQVNGLHTHGQVSNGLTNCFLASRGFLKNLRT